MGSRWFGGDRTIEQQMTGLDQLWPRVVGKSVLDVGCAEGAIAVECAARGASEVFGIELRPDAAKAALALAKRRGFGSVCTFVVEDATYYTSAPARFEVLLLLAVLHKLKNPRETIGRMLDQCVSDTATVVLRTRARDWPILTDARSGFVPQDIRFELIDRGFSLVHEDKGPEVDGQPAEWVGIFERGAA